MTLHPYVSVIMPVYNGELFLRNSIESILSQTFKDFELIVIDDGSTDATPSILDEYGGNIRRLTQSNSGPAVARNNGIRESRGDFIAIMDADDIASPERLQKEVDFLEHKKDIGILGSYCHTIDYRGNIIGISKVPISDLDIRWNILFSNPFIHSTIIFRKEILINLGFSYDIDFQPAEDYDLFSKMANVTKTANLPYPLIKYRIYKHSLSAKTADRQIENHVRVSVRLIEENFPGFLFSNNNFGCLPRLFVQGQKVNKDLFSKRAILAEELLDLWEAFKNKHLGNPELSEIQNNVVLKASRMVIYPAFQKGWVKSIAHLSSLDKFWPRDFINTLPKGILDRLVGYKINHYRPQ